MKLSQVLLIAALAPAAAISTPHFNAAALKAGFKKATAAHAMLSSKVTDIRGRRLDAHESLSPECTEAVTSMATECPAMAESMSGERRHLLEAHEEESDLDVAAICADNKCKGALDKIASDCSDMAGVEAMGMMCDPCMIMMSTMETAGAVCDEDAGGDMCGKECGEVLSDMAECMPKIMEMMTAAMGAERRLLEAHEGGDDDDSMEDVMAAFENMGKMQEVMCVPCIRVMQEETPDACDGDDPCQTPACVQYAVNVADACEGFDDTKMKEVMEAMGSRRHLLEAHEGGDDDEMPDIAALTTEMKAAIETCKEAGVTIPESTVSEKYAAMDDDDGSVFGMAAVGACAAAALA